MQNVLACNLGSYRKYRETAYEHLRKIGLSNVEIPLPEDVDRMKAELDGNGLSATSVIVRCDPSHADVVDAFAASFDAVATLGAKVIFTSMHAGEMDRGVVYDKLRQMGERARPYGILIGMETHPDLITNGDVALETMQGVDHPNVRVNFDTGNIYYYNEGRNSVDEIRKIAKYVSSVHLKDTNGGFKAFDFPTIGEGVVDFAGVFREMNAVGFHGPFTMELEGIRGEELTVEGTHRRIEESIAHLKKLGCI